MFPQRTDIAERLGRLKKAGDENLVLDEVARILQRDNYHEVKINEKLNKLVSDADNAFQFDLMDTGRIFHISQIRKICIDYRLRFLESVYFKGQIPDTAISEIKRLERLHQIEIKGFKLVAPSRLFRLENRDDPLLFAPIGNNYYYLIAKWGNDLHPFRKVFAWPFKSVVNLTLAVVLISYLLTLMIPDGLFSKSGSSAEFWIVFLFIFKSLAAIVIFYGFALGKNFNPAIWNSKYFNV